MKKMKRRDVLGAFAGSLVGFGKYPFLKSGSRRFDERRTRVDEASDVVLKILGSAQDGGLPELGCRCQYCSWARENSEFRRLISSLAILDFKENNFYFVDATPDIRVQFDMAWERLRPEGSARANSLQGVLLTHAHIGHYTGLMFFGFESISTRNLLVYCSRRMREFLANNGPWSQLVKQENIRLMVLSPDEKLMLTPRVSIIPFLVPHRDEYSDTLGFSISTREKKVLYIPDIQNWNIWERSIIEEVDKVDIALLDGTFYSPEELPGRDLGRIGHPFIKESIEKLRNVPKKGKTVVYFTHLNHSNLALDPEGEALKYIVGNGFRIASDGLELFL